MHNFSVLADFINNEHCFHKKRIRKYNLET